MRRLLSATLLCLLTVPLLAGAAPPPDPVAWVRPGFAEVRTLHSVDLDGDGGDELLLGARGLAAFDTAALASGTPRWWRGWSHDPDDVLDGGDNVWVTGSELADVTGDEVPDLLVTTSDTDAYAIDGVTGDVVWWNPETGGGLSFGFALIGGADGPPDLFPTGGRDAISGTTGEVLWTAPGLAKNPKAVASGDLDGQPGLDVVVAIYPPGAGTNPTTLVGALTSPTVFAYTADGSFLWEYRPVAPIESIATADVDGDGRDEVVLGTYQGTVTVVTADGLPLWSSPTGLGAIDVIEVADLDGDGRDDLVVANTGGNGGAVGEYRVYGISGLGARLWSYDLRSPIASVLVTDVVGSEAPEVIVGGGRHLAAGNSGVVAALAVGPGGAGELWRVATHRTAMSLVRSRVSGADEIVIGAADATLRGVDPGTGAVAWTHHLGGFTSTVASGDLDGDGSTEIATGDDVGQIIVTGADGRRRWSDRLDIGNDGYVSSLAFGDLDGDGVDELVAVGQRLFTTGDRATVRAYGADGEPRWTRSLRDGIAGIRVRDLDGDGRAEIVAGDGGATCGVRVLEGADGATRWRTGITDCFTPHIDIGDIDGDGALEIAYAEQNFLDEPWVALLEADGSVVWSRGILDSSTWVRVVDGGLVHGGNASGTTGHVTRRGAAGGGEEWRTAFPRPGDRSSATRAVTVAPDLDRDGRRDLVVSTDASDLRLLSGRDGRVLWTHAFEPVDLAVSQRHESGPVAFVDGPSPALVAAQWSIGRARARAFVVTPGGGVLAEVELPDRATGITLFQDEAGVRGVVIASGLGARALVP